MSAQEQYVCILIFNGQQEDVQHAQTTAVVSIFESEHITIEKSHRLPKHRDLSAHKMHFSCDTNRVNVVRKKLQEEEHLEFFLATVESISKKFKLVIFDVDGTLLDAECIDEIAREAGVVEKVAELTRKAMEQEWDFSQALRERLQLIAGLPEEDLKNVWKRLELKNGVYSALKAIKSNGIKIAMVSGGFTFFTDRMASLLEFDYAFANMLEVESGRLTGHATPPIVDGHMKAKVLEAIAKREGISLSETVAVGDGSNDRFMIQKAGLGVAFHPKPVLKQYTPHHLNSAPMTSLCYLLGLKGWNDNTIQDEEDYTNDTDTEDDDDFQRWKDLISKDINDSKNISAIIPLNALILE